MTAETLEPVGYGWFDLDPSWSVMLQQGLRLLKMIKINHEPSCWLAEATAEFVENIQAFESISIA